MAMLQQQILGCRQDKRVSTSRFSTNSDMCLPQVTVLFTTR